LYAVEEDSTG